MTQHLPIKGIVTEFDEPTYRARPELNASLLKCYMEEKSLFQARHYEQHGLPETEALRFGSAFHESMELGGRLSDRYAVLPYDSLRTKAAKDWRDDQVAIGKTVIRQTEAEQLECMHAAIYQQIEPHPDILHLIKNGRREIGIVNQGYKALFDLVDLDQRHAVDYKTVRDITPRRLWKSAADLGWYMQAYHYMRVLAGHTKAEQVQDVRFSFVFISKKAPYEVVIADIEQEALELGRYQWGQADRRLQQARLDGEYPGYGRMPMAIPSWALGNPMDEIEAEDIEEDEEDDR